MHNFFWGEEGVGVGGSLSFQSIVHDKLMTASMSPPMKAQVATIPLMAHSRQF